MPWTPSYVGSGGIKVGGLGDSVMVLTVDNIASFASVNPYEWTQACWMGVSAQNLLDFGWAQALSATVPKHVFIFAGLHDCYVPDYAWNGFGVLGMQAQIINSFPTAQVHWAKLYGNPPTPPPSCSLQAHIAGFNNGLTYWDSQIPNFHVVDWPTAILWFAGMNVAVLDSDGVHPNEGGQNVLANLFKNSMTTYP